MLQRDINGPPHCKISKASILVWQNKVLESKLYYFYYLRLTPASD